MCEWSEWIEHDGKSMPVAIGSVVEVKYLKPCHFVSGGRRIGIFGQRRVMVARGPASWIYGSIHDRSTWSDSQRGGNSKAVPIIRYRIRKPKGLTILEDIARNVDQTEKV